MASMPATIDTLLTAEQFAALPNDVRSELVKGRVIEVPPPGFMHGRVVIRIGALLDHHVRAKKLGWVSGAESGFVTGRNPDTVRGVDILFVSYERLPVGQRPTGYILTAPNLVFEVLSPEDRWPVVLHKTSEYLQSGVNVVCVVEPELRMIYVYRAEDSPVILRASDTFALPEILGDFAVPVADFFE